MSIPEFCLKRPVMVVLLTISVTIFGALAFRGLPVSYLPNVDFPTITVTVNYPGASPENMATAVAAPLEKQFATIDGVTSIISSSQLGYTTITLQFVLSRDINSCALDVMTAINTANTYLPSNLPNPPTFKKTNPALTPVLYFTLHSKALPLTEVDFYAESLIAQRMAMVEGVSEVIVYGSQKRSVRAKLDTNRLASYGLGPNEVASAMSDSNVNLPVGVISGDKIAYTLEADGQLSYASDYHDLILARNDQRFLRMSDIAELGDLPENDKTGARLDGEASVGLAIQRQPGANSIAVANGIKAILPELRAIVPAAISFEILHDDSLPMIEGVQEVLFTIFHTVVVVIIITYLFLGSFRSTLIPSLALPVSLFGTGLIFAYFNYSVDTLSLMALMLAVGFVTDDAVVVMENVYRHIEQGKTVPVAAAEGSTEISFPVIGMTLSLAAVFIPFLLMGGVIGRLFSEFAVVITSAVLISGIVSLTLTPLLCAHFAKPEDPNHPPWVVATLCSRGITALTNMYAWTLRLAMKAPLLVLFSGMAMIAATGWLLYIVPKDFMPPNDTGVIITFTESTPGTSFTNMLALQEEAVAIIRQNPNVLKALSVVGTSQNPMNNGIIIITLKPFKPEGPRVLHPTAIADDLRRSLAVLPGLICYPSAPPAIRFGGRSTKSTYQLTLKGEDIKTLYPASEKLLEELKKQPELTDVTTDLNLGNPTLSIHIDRDKTYSLGLSAASVENALGNLFSANQVSQILGETDQYQLIIEGSSGMQSMLAGIEQVFLSVSSKAIPLGSVADWQVLSGPLTVSHSEQQPAVTLSFDLAEGMALGDATNVVDAAAAKVLPDSVSHEFQGTAQIFQSTMSDMFTLLILALAVIYVILGILYESFWHPVTILSGLPAAAAGGVLALILFNRPLDIYGMTGLVLLIGLVKKNAILVVDFALEEMRKGKDIKPMEAAVVGSVQRFRPIMMTTLAALAAGVIIALAGGQSGDTRRGLGLVLTGGLILSQVVTLYLTPVMFQYVERVREWLSGVKATPASPEKTGVQ